MRKAKNKILNVPPPRPRLKKVGKVGRKISVSSLKLERKNPT